MPNILVLGDVHGEWAYLASLLLYLRPDICIVAGDFGWWPGRGDLPHEAMPREVLERTEIHFAVGNHENHRELLAAAPRGCFAAVEIAPHIIYHPRGSTMALTDGRTVFFAGGAKSVDWRWRHEGATWFREELLLRITCRNTCPTLTWSSHTRFQQSSGWTSLPVSAVSIRTWTRRRT